MLKRKTSAVSKRLRFEDIWFPALILILLLIFIIFAWIRADSITQYLEKGGEQDAHELLENKHIPGVRGAIPSALSSQAKKAAGDSSHQGKDFS